MADKNNKHNWFQLRQWAKQFEGPKSQVNSQAIRILILELARRPTIELFVDNKIRVEPQIVHRFKEAVRRLSAGEPLDYILGWSEFKGRRFQVDSHVLIPRPETEEMLPHVKEVLSLNRGEVGLKMKALDIGTGSGCIAITMALENKSLDVFAWDISQEALVIAESNAVRLEAAVQFSCIDMLQLPPSEKFDLIVCNPPYLSEKDYNEGHHFLKWEPKKALVADREGLFYYEWLAENIGQILQPGGVFLAEIGHDQKCGVQGLFCQPHWKGCAVKKDSYGKDRFLIAFSA